VFDHDDHDAGKSYPEDPSESCKYLGNDLWSCGWIDNAQYLPEEVDG
jgi:hypothetical protein